MKDIKENLNNATWSGIEKTNIFRKPSKRLMIVLIAKGCEWAKNGGPCTMCNYWICSSKKVTTENLVNQFKNEIAKYDFAKIGIEEIDLFNSGSFLNDDEVSEKARIEIMRIISRIETVKKVLIESRPEYITKEKITRIKNFLREKILEIGIGLETSSDSIREKYINKGFDLKSFTKAVKIIKNGGALLLVHVLIKPPFLTEQEAITDTITTTKYIFRLGKKLKIQVKVALEPVIIKKPSLVYQLWEKGKYKKVWLWSIIEILKQTYGLGNVQVGLSSEGMKWQEFPVNCKKCSKKIIDAILKFNQYQNISVFNKIDCDCKKDWEKELNKN